MNSRQLRSTVLIPWQRLHGKLVYLLVTLVVLVVIRPLFSDGSVLFAISLVAFLTGTIYVLASGNRLLLTAGIVLASCHSAGIVASQIWPPGFSILFGVTTGILFYCLVVWIILHYIFSADKVTGDMLYGAASVYLLLGIIWTLAYGLLEVFAPGSLSIEASEFLPWDDLMYFSFVTLTTLGFGDVVPLSSQAKSLTVLQAMTGVFYTTVIVARLVGIYIVHQTGKKS